jgi:hypothetical protein
MKEDSNSAVLHEESNCVTRRCNRMSVTHTLPDAQIVKLVQSIEPIGRAGLVRGAVGRSGRNVLAILLLLRETPFSMPPDRAPRLK